MCELLGAVGSGFVIRPPFYGDYGCHIFAGDRLFINYDCTVGAGSVVTQNIPNNVVAVGNPCRVIKTV